MSKQTYILDGSFLPNPKQFGRRFKTISTDFLTITGKSVRDVRTLTKEIFLLNWELLSVAEVDAILAIVDKNIPVDFEVINNSLTIASSSVLLTVNGIDYSILGSNYLASLVLELEQVTET